MKDYHINIFYSKRDAGYIADIPDLKECPAFGDTLPTRWITSTQWDMHPQYAPDGHHIAFTSNRSGSNALWLADAEGAPLQRLTQFETAFVSIEKTDEFDAQGGCVYPRLMLGRLADESLSGLFGVVVKT